MLFADFVVPDGAAVGKIHVNSPSPTFNERTSLTLRCEMKTTKVIKWCWNETQIRSLETPKSQRTDRFGAYLMGSGFIHFYQLARNQSGFYGCTDTSNGCREVFRHHKEVFFKLEVRCKFKFHIDTITLIDLVSA